MTKFNKSKIMISIGVLFTIVIGYPYFHAQWYGDINVNFIENETTYIIS